MKTHATILITLMTAFLMLGAEPLAASTVEKTADEIAAHRAVYNIDMVSNRSGSQILNVDGEMMYEWRPACDGWNTQHRFNLVYEYTETPTVNITSHFSTFESEDGKNLSFSSRRKSNNVLLEEYRGHAKVYKDVVGAANYTIPSDLNHELAAGAVLPTQHTAQMIEAIRRGQTFFNATVFDGSDETGAVQVNSFIGKQLPPAQAMDKKDINSKLLKEPAYKVRLAFFPVASDAATPEYEMDMVFHENGIIREMLIHYDDFSIKQTLKALKAVGDGCPDRSLNE